MSETSPNGANAGPRELTTGGCALIFFNVSALVFVAGAGLVWLVALLLQPGALTIGSITAGYAAALLLLGGAGVLLLRRARFPLWRGAALSLAIGGGFAALVGGLSTLDRALRWQALPGWLLPLAGALYGAVALLLLRRRVGGASGAGAVWLGAAAGLLMSAAWGVVGALGTPGDVGVGLLGALAMGLISTAAMSAVFAYSRESLAARPFWSAALAGAVYAALLPGLLAARGFGVQGLLLSIALLPAGLVAGALLALGDGAERRGPGALLALFALAYLLPLLWTEGFEGDWMFEELGPAWGPAALAGLLVGGALAVILLAARGPLARFTRRAVLPAGLAAVALAGAAALYIAAGQPGLQPFTFFVVMDEQTDTSFAREIEGQEARYRAVYEALTAHALETQSDIRAALDGQQAAYTAYYMVSGLEVETYNPLLRGQLARRGDVWKILDSPHARPLPAWAEPLDIATLGGLETHASLAWGVDAIDAERVWEEYEVTGEGVVVGLADSGVDWRHDALRSQYLGREGDHTYTWFDPWFGTAEPTDTGGHGTHTAGIVLGQGGVGVAPGAEWIACRNLARNLGNPAAYLDCMQFLFAPHPPGGDPFAEGRPELGADLTSNSWGCPVEEGCDGETLAIGVQHLRDAGQMFVVSAGNEGPACSTIGSPATADAAFSVGAVDEAGGIAFFSSRGPVLVDGSGRVKPDVAAPGVQILSSVPGGAYARLDGTSMAGPHVAGLVALLWSADPGLVGDIETTEAIITGTADPQTAPDLCGATGGPQNNVYGYGLVDADEAVGATRGE